MRGEPSPGSVVRAGEILAGKYKVERVLGSGGMAYVVAAEHLDLGGRVAVKLLRSDVLGDRDAVARFAREARAMFRLRSEHVAKVLDVGRLRDGAPFMVMEHLIGTDLGAYLATRGRLPIAEALDYVVQACEAVAEAHALGIVHRDLKPHNLFVTRRADGSAHVKVLDFGISKLVGFTPETMRLTHATTVMGSPFYMSPEQLRSSASADARSDVWALGVVLYELLTGEVPFAAESTAAQYARITEEAAVPPHARVPEIPPELSAVVMACLERRPEERVQSVEELVARLEPFGAPALAGAAARVAAVSAAVTRDRVLAHDHEEPISILPRAPGEGAATGTTWEGSSSSRRARVVSAALAGAAVAVLLLVGVGWSLSQRAKRAADLAEAPSAPAAPAAAATEAPTSGAAPAPFAAVDASVAREPIASSRPAAAAAAPVPARSAKPRSVKPRAAASFDPYDSRTWGGKGQ